MAKPILLTSFAIWKAQQASNSSDDLLLATLENPHLRSSLYVLRQLPVNLPVAREIAIAKINQIKPQSLLCCGMAESRTQLSVESRAVVGNQILHTKVNLEELVAGLSSTEISYDAGRFVCNSLYYAMLNYLQQHQSPVDCLFVHVPILTPENRQGIVADFSLLLNRIITA